MIRLKPILGTPLATPDCQPHSHTHSHSHEDQQQHKDHTTCKCQLRAQQSTEGHHHGHHCHGKAHHHRAEHPVVAHAGQKVLTVRSFSGMSGDMMLAGLAKVFGLGQEELEARALALGVPALKGCLTLEPHSVKGIAGWWCRVNLPEEHTHRTLTDILGIIDQSAMEEKAKSLATRTFTLLAEAEGLVHGMPTTEVAFHEVGALDSILDICLASSLFAAINPGYFCCSPLPLADGTVHCAHGLISTPAPATCELLQGMQVCGFAGKGETVTPTAAALLKAFGVQFGPWPAMTLERKALVYGTRVFDNAPNGTLWAIGQGV